MRALPVRSARRGTRSSVRSCSQRQASDCCLPSKRYQLRAPDSTRRVKPIRNRAGVRVTTIDDPPFRILPKLTDQNRDFWTAGSRGELRFWRCLDCGEYIHPPLPMCPRCHSKKLATEPVSGRATLASYSINYQPWMPGPELPYVVAIVEMVEQTGLRVTATLVN